MYLTPETLICAYEYLRSTPPFKQWGLPHADLVEFRVMARKRLRGQYEHPLHDNRRAHVITIFPKYNKTHGAVLETMGHEMVHLCQREGECRSRATAPHGKKFKDMAQQVCRWHGWDLKEF